MRDPDGIRSIGGLQCGIGGAGMNLDMAGADAS